MEDGDERLISTHSPLFSTTLSLPLEPFVQLFLQEVKETCIVIYSFLKLSTKIFTT